MIERLEKVLNCREHLRKNLPKFIEAFVKYYGEDRREEIERKLNNPLYLAYLTPKTLESTLFSLQKEITKEIETPYVRKAKTLLSGEDLFETSIFEYIISMPLSKYRAFYELYKLGPEGRIEQFKEESLKAIQQSLPELTKEEYEEMIRTQTVSDKYAYIKGWIRNNLEYYIDLHNAEKKFERSFRDAAPLLHKIDPNITADNYSYYLDREELEKLNTLSDQLPEMEAEYHKRMEKYAAFEKESKEQEAFRQKLMDEYYIRFIDENLDLLGEEDRIKYEEYKKNPIYFYQLTDYTRYLFGYSLRGEHPLELFGEEAEEKLKTGKQWKQDDIKNGRIKYFKTHGIDLGDKYEDYLQSEEVQRIWPSKEKVNKFIESRNRLLNEFNNQYFLNIPSHRAGREEIEKLHLLNKGDSFNAAIYTSDENLTCINPNIVETPDGYKVVPLAIISCGLLEGTIDHMIVHELNHLFELSEEAELKDNHYEVICGWEYLDEEIETEAPEVDTLHKDRSKRKYELFSEIMNELIAEDISKGMKEDQVFVFDSPENSTYLHTTSYEHTFFIISDFYKEFKKEIIESRKPGQIHIIWDAVGKENFDALNDLFHDYYEQIGEMKIYRLFQSLQQKEENELTAAFAEIVRKRNIILDKMRKHNMYQATKPEEIVEENQDKK